MGCKALIPYSITILTRSSILGLGGYIVSSAISATVSQGASGMLWTNYQRHLMGHTNALYGKSKSQIGNLPDGCSYVLLWLPALSVSRSWQNF
jgi:hypothetical protein